MSAPTFKDAGTVVNGTSSVTAAWPSVAADDIGILAITASAGSVAPTTPSGWTELAASQGPSGTNNLYVFWQRATGSSMPSVTVADSIGTRNAVILTYSGCATTGDPTEAGAGQQNSSSTTCGFPTITTLGADRAVLLIGMAAATGAIRTLGNPANSTLASVTNRVNFSLTARQGLAISDGSLASAGSNGTTTATVSTSDTSAAIVVALISPAAGGAETFDETTTLADSTVSATEAQSNALTETTALADSTVSSTEADTPVAGSETFNETTTLADSTVSATESQANALTETTTLASSTVSSTEADTPLAGAETFNETTTLANSTVSSTETDTPVGEGGGGSLFVPRSRWSRNWCLGLGWVMPLHRISQG